MITSELMRAACATADGRAASEKFRPILNELLPKFGIESSRAVAMFIAQVAHESAGFTRLSENLNYSATGLAATWPSRFRAKDGQANALAQELHRNPQRIANVVYANRYGNGDPLSGDGWRYRGRGLKQITFKDNYRACSDALGLDLVSDPDLLLEPRNAVESACWYWLSRKLTPLAEAGDIVGVTKAINGGTNGLAERTAYYSRLCKAMGVSLA